MRIRLWLIFLSLLSLLGVTSAQEKLPKPQPQRPARPAQVVSKAATAEKVFLWKKLNGCREDTRGGHTYMFCPKTASFAKAREACSEIGLGLVEVNDAKENAWLASNVRRYHRLHFYLGLSDAAYEGAWRWASTGEVVWCGDARGEQVRDAGYENWRRGEPETMPLDERHAPDRHDCAATNRHGRWESVSCDEGRGYICETKAAHADETFVSIATAVRDDYRTGKRLVSHAELNTNQTPNDVFARYPESIGMRPCVDRLVESQRQSHTADDVEIRFYEQRYENVRVFARGYAVALDSGSGAIQSFTGHAEHNIEVDTKPRISKAKAYFAALDAIDGRAWQYRPRPEGRLVVFPEGFGPEPTWRLAWVFRFPRREDRETIVVAVAADEKACDILMESGETHGLCSLALVPAVPFPPPQATLIIESFQHDFLGEANVAQAVETGRTDLPYGLLSYSIDPDPTGPAHSSGLLYATCEGVDFPYVAALGDSHVDALVGETDLSVLVAPHFLGAQKAIIANADLFQTSSGLPWIGIDGAGAEPVRIDLVEGVGALFSPSERLIRLDPVFYQRSEAAIEILGHEIAHGILQTLYGSGYISDSVTYNPEARALSEGFADIVSEVNEIFHRGLLDHSAFCFDGDRSIGGTRVCERDMRDPGESDGRSCTEIDGSGNVITFDCPADYRGPDYSRRAMCRGSPPPGSLCLDPHRNSTVLSHWFYLLSVGQSAVSALRCPYNVQPLHPDPAASAFEAAQLLFKAFRDNPTVALMDYPSLAHATIDIARATLPAELTQSVVEAWYAVNVIQESFFEAMAGDVDPARESSAIDPWYLFKWPWPDPDSTVTSWDFQISNAPFGLSPGPLVTPPVIDELSDISEFVLIDGKRMGYVRYALPASDSRRWFWRVRPHGSDDWIDCYPIHSFERTSGLPEVIPVTVGERNGSDEVIPGRIRVAWNRAPGAVGYRVQLHSGAEPTCAEGEADLERFVEQSLSDELAEEPTATTRFEGIQPLEHYWVTVQAVAPDGVGEDHSACAKMEFRTASLDPPEPGLPGDDDTFNLLTGRERFPGGDGTYDPLRLSWTSTGGAERWYVRFYEIEDIVGRCAEEPSHVREVTDACPTTCYQTLEDVFGELPNPTGYCWNVVSVADNGVESAPSASRRFWYFYPFLRIIRPGVQAGKAELFQDPAPLAHESYGQPVEFEWEAAPGAYAYVLKVGRWPWRSTGAPEPANCLEPDFSSCTAESFDESAVVQTSGTSIVLPPEAGGEGRYCARVWPLIDDPRTPGTVGDRQPLLDTSWRNCYTTGPASPMVVVIDSGGSYTVRGPLPTDTEWPRSAPTGPVTGRIVLGYVPDSQYRVLIRLHEPDEVLTDEIIPCELTDNAYIYSDIDSCEIPFSVDMPPNREASVMILVYNSDTHPPVLNDDTYVDREFITMRSGPCGGEDHYCCQFEECDRGNTCIDGICQPCGGGGEICCDSGRCDSGHTCVGGICERNAAVDRNPALEVQLTPSCGLTQARITNVGNVAIPDAGGYVYCSYGGLFGSGPQVPFGCGRLEPREACVSPLFNLRDTCTPNGLDYPPFAFVGVATSGSVRIAGETLHYPEDADQVCCAGRASSSSQFPIPCGDLGLPGL